MRASPAQTLKNAIFATIWHKSGPNFHPKQPMEAKIQGMERPIHGMETKIHGTDRHAHPIAPPFQR